MQEERSAILFFTRTFQDEFRGNNLGLNHDRFRQYYTLLTKKVRLEAEKSGLDIIEINSKEQIGSTFGERISNATKKVQSLGYKSVIIVGNDSPQLSSDDLRFAHQELEAGRSVLGNDYRGGCYLIAFQFSRIKASDLLSIDWQTASVADQLSACFENPSYLNDKIDINEFSDIIELINNDRKLARLLCHIFFIEVLSLSEFFNVETKFYTDHSRRGPPVLLAA